MEIRTKFRIGDHLWSITNFKATEIEVAAIVIDADGVWVRNKDYALFHQDNCFASKDELIQYLTSE